MAKSQKKSGGSKKYGRNKRRSTYSGPSKRPVKAGSNPQARDLGADNGGNSIKGYAITVNGESKIEVLDHKRALELLFGRFMNSGSDVRISEVR